MIDEALDEFDIHLRVTLDEMIPKLVAIPTSVGEDAEDAQGVVVGILRQPSRRARRFVAALLAVAVTILGLVMIARRDDAVPFPPASPAGPSIPPWYDLIKPSLPTRFSSVALTMVNAHQLWFVAIGPADGKALEIQLSFGGYSTEPTTAIDSTGVWTETAQGWSVQTTAGLFVDVRCGIGVRGRDPVNPRNYCDLTSTGPFTKADIRAVADALATSLTPSIFDTPFGAPQQNSLDPAPATALIAAAVPEQQFISDTDWGQHGSDHVYEFGGDPVQSDTSVRILHGLYPPLPASDGDAWALYDDAAAFWVGGAGGMAVRISTTNPLPESLTRLQALADDLVSLESTSAPTATSAATEAADATAPSVSLPENSARSSAWEAAVNEVITSVGLDLAGTEYAPADVQPFNGAGIANVGAGQIEFAVRAFESGEYQDGPMWQQQTAGSSQPGVNVPEGILFLDDHPSSSARRAVVVSPTGVVTIVAHEVAQADLPPIEMFETAARQLAAAMPTVLAAT